MKNSKTRYILLYTAVFLTVCLAVFFPFIEERRSLIYSVDGESQYIIYLRYMGQYLRDTLSGFLHGHFVPKIYDFSIGIGDDIGAIVRFHPLDFLSVFVPEAYTETLYGIITLIRFYLAGLAFSAYAFAFPSFSGVSGQDEVIISSANVLSGSLVYVFCGFMLIRVTNHPTYGSPFIVLPLLFLGLERAAARKGNILFPVAVLLGFWSNYYFMYICSIALFFYAILRYPAIVREKRGKTFLFYAGKLAGLYMAGMMSAMATLLPAILRYRTSYRVSQTAEMQNLFIYADKRRYIAWFLNLISPFQSSGNGLDLNFAVTVLPCLAILFSSAFRKLRTLKMTLILELSALLIPGAGYVFAAMNNENNRWVFLIAFSLGMCCVCTIDRLGSLSRRELIFVIVSSLLFLLAVAAERILGHTNRFNEAGALQLLALLGLLIILRLRKVSVHVVRKAVLLATMIFCGFSGYMTYSVKGGALVSDFMKQGDTLERYAENGRKVVLKLQDDSFYRVDSAAVTHNTENCAEYLGYRSIGMYNSILNANLIRNLLDEENSGLDAVTQVHDLDGRAAAENLAHVKYYVTPSWNTGKIPYGFSQTPVLTEGDWSVYENEHLLSAGWTSRRYITWDDYAVLSGPEKEAVKLEAAVLPANSPGLEQKVRSAGLERIKVPDIQIESEEVILPKTGDGCTAAEGGFVSQKKKASFTISVGTHAGTCTYLKLKGVRSPQSVESLYIVTDGIAEKTTIREEDNVHTLRRQDYLINLGFSRQDTVLNVRVVFSASGFHGLSGIDAIYVPMDGYEERIENLNAESLQDEEITDGLLTGEITVDRPRLAVFSIAAQDGWQLFVDGERQQTEIMDGMYIGTFLDTGTHHIRLVYRTPGLLPGVFCSIAGLMLIAILALYQYRKRCKPLGHVV